MNLRIHPSNSYLCLRNSQLNSASLISNLSNEFPVKALLSIIDLNVADRHNEKRTVSQDLLLATYDILSGILVREIDFLLPPCENQSRKQALASLMDRSIISHHSDQTNSGENHQVLYLGCFILLPRPVYRRLVSGPENSASLGSRFQRRRRGIFVSKRCSALC